MTFTNAKWMEADRNVVVIKIDGMETFVPKDPKNSDYAEIIRLGLPVDDPDQLGDGN